MIVKISSKPKMTARATLDFREGNDYLRPITFREVEPTDSIVIVDDAAETIKRFLDGRMPRSTLETYDLLKAIMDEVFKLRDDRPFSDNAKLSAYLDVQAAANYVFNMMCWGDVNFEFQYEKSG